MFHLNRKAGTLDASGIPTLGEVAAANEWAGTTGLGLLAALNELAEPGRDPIDFNELQGVLNELAGTSGLGVEGAAAAL